MQWVIAVSEKVLRISRILIEKKKGAEALRYLQEGIKKDPTNVALYVCLGDALKQALEYDLALKIYRRALVLAKSGGNPALAEEVQNKIDNIYILKPEDVLDGPQIGFFIRSIMKMLSKLGKQDWF